MSLWGLNKPPTFHNPGHGEAVKTPGGWADPVTGEVLAAISELDSKAGGAKIRQVSFGASSYIQGANLSVSVHFDEKVDVPAGSSIVVSSTGSGNTTLYAAAQSNVYDVVFNKKSDNTTQETVPAEAATLTIASQTLSGSIVDHSGGASVTSVSGTVAGAAGSRVVA